MTLSADEASRRVSPAALPLLAVTQDAQLLEALRKVSGPSQELFEAASEIDLAAQVMKHHAGVAVLDCAAIASPIATLTQRLVAQFPDLVLIVSGGLEEQTLLSGQIADGSVHRFLHKPVSEQRVRLFVEAARRRHAELHALPAALHQQSRASKFRWHGLRWGAALVFAALAGALGWVAINQPLQHVSQRAASPGPAPPGKARADGELESLLRRADEALSAGNLTSPAGASAADLYRDALRRNARDPRALEGLGQVVGRLLSSAQEQLQQGRLDAAQALAEQAHAIDPQHAGVAFLLGQIGTAREHAVLEKAQQAAAHGNVRGALAVLDEAAQSAHRPALVDEARQGLAQQQADTRVSDYLARARDALTRAQLIAPSQDNARFYIESARTLAPDDARVAAAVRDLIARLESEARQAIAARNPDAADAWTTAAAEMGAEAAPVAELRRQVEELRAASSAAARAAVIDGLEVHLQAASSDSRTRGGALAETTVNEGSLVRTHYVAPKFPEEARRRGLEGWVELHFVVLTDGTVSALTVTGSQPAGIFDRAALDAVAQWRYQPVTRQGQAVTQRAQLRLRFRLR